MKHVLTSTVATFILAVCGTTVTLADDPQLPNRLAIQRAAAPAPDHTTTVGVYSHGGVVGDRVIRESSPGVIYEFHPNGHGQLNGLYRAVE
jgi:hypothetical protein